MDTALEILGPMILIQLATWNVLHPNVDFELDVAYLINQLTRYLDHHRTKKSTFLGELVYDE